MAFTYRQARERLEEFFLRLKELAAQAATIQPATIQPGPTDANGSPVEETADVAACPEDTKTRSGTLHPPYKTGI